jgi:hypothetical protein
MMHTYDKVMLILQNYTNQSNPKLDSQNVNFGPVVQYFYSYVIAHK